MAHKLIVLTVPAEDSNLFPSAHDGPLTTPAPGGSNTLFWPLWVPTKMHTHVYYNKNKS